MRITALRLEQRDLALLLRAPAGGLRLIDDRLDARLLAFGDLGLLGIHHHLALDTRLTPGAVLAQSGHGVLEALARPTVDHQRRAADGIHNRKPGNAREQRETGQEQRQQQDRGTDDAKRAYRPLANDLSQDPARRRLGREIAGYEVQGREPAARRQGQEKAGPAYTQGMQIELTGIGATAKHQPTAVGDHDRRQIGEIAE